MCLVIIAKEQYPIHFELGSEAFLRRGQFAFRYVRQAHNLKVLGSNPSPATKFF